MAVTIDGLSPAGPRDQMSSGVPEGSAITNQPSFQGVF